MVNDTVEAIRPDEIDELAIPQRLLMKHVNALLIERWDGGVAGFTVDRLIERLQEDNFTFPSQQRRIDSIDWVVTTYRELGWKVDTDPVSSSQTLMFRKRC